MRGIVNSDDEPIVEIFLLTKEGQIKVPAIIDTGFNGFVSAPGKYIKESDWEFVGYEEYEIATGEIVKEKVYIANLIFDDEPQYVPALSSGSKDILIGTKLLRDRVLLINFVSRELEIKT